MSEGTRPYAQVRFSKRGPARFVGHLDLARAFDRAVRRADLPVAYSEGFNPRAKISFAHPLQVGAESEAELCFIELAQPVDAEVVERRLGPELPAGLSIVELHIGRRGRRSPIASLSEAGYEAELSLSRTDDEQVAEAVRALVSAESVQVLRRTKRSEATVNIRPGIVSLQYRPGEAPVLQMRLRVGSEALAKPDEVISALNARLGTAGEVAIERLVRKSLD